MAITISCIILFLFAILSGRLWVTTWGAEEPKQEPRKLTSVEQYRVFRAIYESMREDE